MEGYGFIVCRRRRTVNSRQGSLGKRVKEAETTARKLHFPDRGLLQTRYILSVLELVRKNARFFLGASVAALALRWLFVFYFPAIVDDSRLYADIATNWLQHGVYGITDSGEIMPTFSRLPGYPAFLAAVFAMFGVGNFRAVLLIQVLL